MHAGLSAACEKAALCAAVALFVFSRVLLLGTQLACACLFLSIKAGTRVGIPPGQKPGHKRGHSRDTGWSKPGRPPDTTGTATWWGRSCVTRVLGKPRTPG